MSGASVVTRSTSLTRHCQTSRAFHCWQRSVNGTSTTMRSTSVIRRFPGMKPSSSLWNSRQWARSPARSKAVDHLPVASAAGAITDKSALLVEKPRMVFRMDAQRYGLIATGSRLHIVREQRGPYPTVVILRQDRDADLRRLGIHIRSPFVRLQQAAPDRADGCAIRQYGSFHPRHYSKGREACQWKRPQAESGLTITPWMAGRHTLTPHFAICYTFVRCHPKCRR